MSYTSRFYSIISALALPLGITIFAPANAQAGAIISAQVFGSQQGTGTGLGTVAVPAIISPNTNNDNTTAGGITDNNLAVVVKRFDNVGFIDIVFNVSPTGGTTEYKIFESVDNNTFIDWSSYRLQLGFGTGTAFVSSTSGDGLDFDFSQFDSAPTSSIFSTVALSEDLLIFSNGIQDTGAETYNFRIDVPDLPQGVTSFTLRQSPVAIPEPSIIAAAAIAGCGLLLRRRLF